MLANALTPQRKITHRRRSARRSSVFGNALGNAAVRGIQNYSANKAKAEWASAQAEHDAQLMMQDDPRLVASGGESFLDRYPEALASNDPAPNFLRKYDQAMLDAGSLSNGNPDTDYSVSANADILACPKDERNCYIAEPLGSGLDIGMVSGHDPTMAELAETQQVRKVSSGVDRELSTAQSEQDNAGFFEKWAWWENNNRTVNYSPRLLAAQREKQQFDAAPDYVRRDQAQSVAGLLQRYDAGEVNLKPDYAVLLRTTVGQLNKFYFTETPFAVGMPTRAEIEYQETKRLEFGNSLGIGFLGIFGLPALATRVVTGDERKTAGALQMGNELFSMASGLVGLRPRNLMEVVRGAPERILPKRDAYLGGTPHKYTATGKAVVENMREQGLIRGEGPLLRGNPNGLEVKAPDGTWHPIDGKIDMAHKIDAVTWWNQVGYTAGAKSPDVRSFMLDANNYVLLPSYLNRSAGARIGATYRAPLPVPVPLPAPVFVPKR